MEKLKRAGYTKKFTSLEEGVKGLRSKLFSKRRLILIGG